MNAQSHDDGATGRRGARGLVHLRSRGGGQAARERGDHLAAGHLTQRLEQRPERRQRVGTLPRVRAARRGLGQGGRVDANRPFGLEARHPNLFRRVGRDRFGARLHRRRRQPPGHAGERRPHLRALGRQVHQGAARDGKRDDRHPVVQAETVEKEAGRLDDPPLVAAQDRRLVHDDEHGARLLGRVADARVHARRPGGGLGHRSGTAADAPNPQHGPPDAIDGHREVAGAQAVHEAALAVERDDIDSRLRRRRAALAGVRPGIGRGDHQQGKDRDRGSSERSDEVAQAADRT